jgi:CDGSH-type Zn-finger protein
MKFKNAKGLNMPTMHRLPEGTYHWCMCGETRNVPFCDGSHEGTGIEPLAFESTGKGTMSLCSCGLSGKPPTCDGKHQDYR